MDHLFDVLPGHDWKLDEFTDRMDSFFSFGSEDFGVRSVQHWKSLEGESLVFTVEPLTPETNIPAEINNSSRTLIELARHPLDARFFGTFGMANDVLTVLTDETFQNRQSTCLSTIRWTHRLPIFHHILEVTSAFSNSHPYYNILTRPCQWLVRATFNILREGYNIDIEEIKYETQSMDSRLFTLFQSPSSDAFPVRLCRKYQNRYLRD